MAAKIVAFARVPSLKGSSPFAFTRLLEQSIALATPPRLAFAVQNLRAPCSSESVKKSCAFLQKTGMGLVLPSVSFSTRRPR
jgi:hypothetical protein